MAKGRGSSDDISDDDNENANGEHFLNDLVTDEKDICLGTDPSLK